MQKRKDFVLTDWYSTAIKKPLGKKTFVFSPFYPQKTAIFGILDCDSPRFWCMKKRPWHMKSRFVHPPSFEVGKTLHEINAIQNAKKRHKTAFSMCISALPLHFKQTKCPLEMPWNATPGHRSPNFPYIPNIPRYLLTEEKLTPSRGKSFFLT